MKNPRSILFCFLASLGTANAQQYAGDWTGSITVQGIPLPLVFHIVKAGDANYTATMDSPMQKAFGLKVKAVEANPESILLDMSDMGIRYNGSMKSDSIKGTFSQGGQNYALNLGRMTTPMLVLKRPQEPKPPFKYKIEEVSFTNEEGLKFAGTLTTPNRKGTHPAVVLVSGSGPQNRDEEILGHKPFWLIADYLTNNGIAVLRYDDRGVAGSEGNFKTATSADFAKDAKAAIAFLRRQSNVDQQKVGVIGHSEGGMIAPMLAADDAEIGFLVLLAAPGISIDQLMLKQTELNIRAAGVPESEVSKVIQLNKACYEAIKNEKDSTASRKKVEALLSAEIPDEATVQELMDQMYDPWFRYFIAYEPQVSLGRVKCPVLAINGDKDQQVTSKENLAGIKGSLEKAGNKNVKIYEAANKNHLFQTTQTGLVSEYGEIEETFSPEILKLMADWINRLK